VELRLPGDEIVPEPRAGEVVIFESHFERGFGLPASPFMRSFFEFFELQPHHLGANAVMVLSAFVTFCEGYLGVWPTPDIFIKFFYFKGQKSQSGDSLMECGAASIYTRSKIGFPKIALPDSSKRWQDTFLYAKNVDPAVDLINLPPFLNIRPPRTNWSYLPPSGEPDLKAMVARAKQLSSTGVPDGVLSGADLVATFLHRRVLPLQRRAHKIGLMSGRLDATRIGMAQPTWRRVIDQVNLITKCQLPEGWQYGLVAFSRARPFPQV
jgi:hypothetical protein